MTVAAVLAGCVVKRGAYDVPEVPIPDQYRNATPEENAASAELTKDRRPVSLSDIGQDAAMIEWWRTFGSKELSELIDRGLANNPDMRIAALHLAQAKARLEIAKAGQAPNVQMPLTAANQAPGGAVGTVPPEGGGGGTQKSYQASIRGNWRVDMWGEQAATVESANFQLWQTIYERDNVQRNVVASIASAYVEYLSLNDRLRIARETEKVLSDMLSTIEKRVAAEDATVLELEQQRAAIFSVRATIPTLVQQREDAINALAFLVGTVPGGLQMSDQGMDSLSPPFALPGLPSALLLRRPDVRMQEARLLAAEADVDAARARALPAFDLSAQAGYSSLLLSRLFQPQTLFWNLLGSISTTLFDAGKRSSEKDLAKSQQEEMVEGYVRTIYQAMREVESALSTIRTSDSRLSAQTEAVDSARRAFEISTEVYTAGAADFITMLDSERTYHRVLDEYQRVRMEQYRGYISLFQALGGGVKPGPALPGKGVRPAPTRVSAPALGKPAKAVASEGLDWSTPAAELGDGLNWQIEDFWQVELAGLYPRTTIGAAWRDLRARYPKLMEGRVLRPSQVGHVEDSGDPQIAWYRLYVAKFTSIRAAHEFCGELLANQQRCRVISSRSDDTVPPPPDYVRPRSVVAAKTDDLNAQPSVKLTEPVPLTVREAKTTKAEEPKPEPVKASELPAKTDAKTGSKTESKPAKTESEPPETPSARLVEVVRKGKRVMVTEKPSGKAVEPKTKPAAKDEAKTQGKAADKPEAEIKPEVAEAASANDTPKPGVDASKPVDGAAKASEPAKAAEKPPVLAASKKEARKADERKKEERKSEEPPAYAVQLGAFASAENAERGFALWQFKGYDAYVVEYKGLGDKTWYSVRTGAFVKRRDALELAASIMRKEDLNVSVVPYLKNTAKNIEPAPAKVDVPVSPKPASPVADALPATPLVEPESAPAAVAAAASEPKVAPASVASSAPKAKVTTAAVKPMFSVQLGAYAVLASANDVRALWDGKNYPVYIAEIRDASGRPLYAVRSGSFASRKEALALEQKLKRNEGASAIVVPAILDAQGKLQTVSMPPATASGSENRIE